MSQIDSDHNVHIIFWLWSFKFSLNYCPFNSLPNDKILDWSKLKGFLDNKINVTEKLKFACGKVENMVGKGENWLPAFSPFPTMFSKGSLYRVVIKSGLCGKELIFTDKS